MQPTNTLIKLCTFIIVVALAGFVFTSYAHERGSGSTVPTDHSLRKPTALNPANTVMNINNITSWIRGDGFHDWVVESSWNGTFPKGTAGFVFSEAILWGGFVNDAASPVLRVGGSGAYSSGLRSGRILTDAQGNVIGREPDDPVTNRPYRVRRDYKTADLTDDAANFFLVTSDRVTSAQIQQIYEQYEIDWLNWPWQKGAPYEDVDSNGVYDPAIDIPGIPGADQTIWLVSNDLDAGRAASTYGSPPIGLEVQQTLWAYALTNPLGNIIFKRVRLIYKGTPNTPSNATIDSMYIVQWSDPDLGQYTDDFAGCDTSLSLGYVYNSSSTDAIYFNQFGLAPPAGGYDFLQGVIVPGSPTDSALFDFKWRRGYKNLPMTVFTFFAAGGARSDPDRGGAYSGTLQWYNLMSGYEPRPPYPTRQPLRDHLGNVTKFELTGDPVAGTGDLDGRPSAFNPMRLPPGDRRIVLSTGPFTMARGDTQEVVLALVGGTGADYLASVTVLKYNDIFAQFAYDNIFKLPSPPPQPKVSVAQLDREIILNWGEDIDLVRSIEEVTRAGFVFEGYNVYQFPTATSRLEEAKRIATFDVVNNITVIVDRVLDAQTGVIITKPVQVGSNSGIKRFINIKRDAIRNTDLFNGTAYYFAVTAYSQTQDPNAPFRTLESAPVILTAVPQAPPPGVRYANRSGDTLRVTHVSGLGDGKVVVTVVQPESLKGSNYRLFFTGNAASKTYGIINTSRNDTIYTGGTNLGPLFGGTAFDYPQVEGMLVAVTDVPFGMNDAKTFYQGTPQWLDGFRFQGDAFAVFNGGVLPGAEGSRYLGHFDPVFPESLSYTVEIRFSTTTMQNAYRLRRTGPGGSYLIQPVDPFVAVPFTVWDISNPSSPRQLTVAWRDQNNNSLWDPPVEDDGVEVIFIYNKTYDPTGTTQFSMPPNAIPDECTVGANADIVYLCSFQVLPGHVLNEAPGTLTIGVNIRFDPSDAFTFSSTAPTFSSAVAADDVERITVFPNPYYGFSSRERQRLEKVVTFYHLPNNATIRIFNLAGTLVRVLQKSGPSQFLEWNLRNDNNLPVASGIYIAHIDMPDLGKTKILKLAIIQEEPILRVY